MTETEIKKLQADRDKAVKDLATANEKLSEETERVTSRDATIHDLKEAAKTVNASHDEAVKDLRGKLHATDTELATALQRLSDIETAPAIGFDLPALVPQLDKDKKPDIRSTGFSANPWIYREAISFRDDQAYNFDSISNRVVGMAKRAFDPVRTGPLDHGGFPTFLGFPPFSNDRVMHVAVWFE